MREQQQLDRMVDFIRDNLLGLAYEYQSAKNENLPNSEHYTIPQCMAEVREILVCAINCEIDLELDDE